MPWQEDKWDQWVPMVELWRRNGVRRHPGRVLLTSPSLAKRLNHSLRAYLGTRQSTTKRWRAQPAAYAAPLGSLTSSPAPPTPTDS